MDKKIVFSTIVFIAIFIFSIFVLSEENTNKIENNETSQQNQEAMQQSMNNVVLFYSDDCPHCKIIEEYIEENNVQEKVSFTRKEVYYNNLNLKELQMRAEDCGLSGDSIGIPFLWDGKNCLMGEQEIIKFFEQKMAEGQ